MDIMTTCKKCGTTIRLQFRDLSKEEALAAADQIDATPRECPGGHVELGGLAKMWQVKEAIHRAFDLGEGEPEQDIPTDREFVEGLLAEGKEVIDGGQKTVPELGLRSIHEFPGLEHLGFGDFASETHRFTRVNSPRGTRFYVLESIEV